MKLPNKQEFFLSIGDADLSIKEDFYSKLQLIESALIKNEIAATDVNNVFSFKPLANLVKGIKLNAPNHEFYDSKLRCIGQITIPSDLCEFIGTYCKGSIRSAYLLLKELKLIARQSPGEHMKERLENLTPIVYFVGLIDNLYYFYIGNNPKYSDRARKTPTPDQLKHSEIIPANGSVEDVKERFKLYFQEKFNNEPSPRAPYSHSLTLDGYCQYCHRPNIPKRKYCSTHTPDRNGNNSHSNSITNSFKNSFRNLGLLLDDEVGYQQIYPEGYIKIAADKRNAEASKNGRLRIVQNNIKSEYFIRLGGWAKHHPIYINFINKLYDLYSTHDNLLDLKDWDSEPCRELISKIFEICRNEIYIPTEFISIDVSNPETKSIKAQLLGKSGMDIEQKLHKNISIIDWILILFRSFQYELIISCKKKEMAAKLKYSN